MANRVVTPLTYTQIKNAKPRDKDYTLPDGYGLHLLVKTNAKKVWEVRYTVNGKPIKTSIGTYPIVSLADARRKRDDYQTKAKQGVNPTMERKEEKQKLKQTIYTFDTVASEYIDKKVKEGKSQNYIDAIKGKLGRHVPVAIAKKHIGEIKRAEIMEALKNADRVSPHSAEKVLLYAKAIFVYAEDMGYIDSSPIGSVKASNVLTKVEVKNYKHITDPRRFGELLNAIDCYNGDYVVRQLLRFTPLVMTRPAEAREAKWSEIDFSKGLWTIPASRMKMKSEHVVPLSKQAIQVLNEINQYTGDKEFVFPSPIRNVQALSENTVNVAIKRMGFGDEQVTHGFRHSASTMLHEHIAEHGAHSLVIEACLAHKDSNQIRSIYNKAEYVAERRKLMQWWADYLDGLKSK